MAYRNKFPKWDTRQRVAAVGLIWGILLSLLLAGCGSLKVPDVPTLVPTEFLPTMIAMTIEARQTEDAAALQAAATQEITDIPTQFPKATASQTPRMASPTAKLVELTQTAAPESSATPTPGRATRTPTLAPTLALPEAEIQIRQPGPLSKVVSPFDFYGNVEPGYSGRVRLELLGEDGRLLVRKIVTYRTDASRIGIAEEIDYEISAVAEAGRLQISTYDQFGRMIALSSVELLLLSLGKADLNPPGSSTQPIIIQEPRPNKLIQGGTVSVSGLARVSSDLPLLVELVAKNGSVAGYRQAEVTAGPADGYSTFSAEIPYKVTAPTWVRLTVKEFSGGRIEGVIQLTSLEILLSP
jgi:hypothetical protein